MTLIPRVLRKRDRDRKVQEAQEAITACQEAINNTPDEAGKAMFQRSVRIWQNRLGALER